MTPWTLDPSGTPIQWSLPTFAKDASGNANTFKADADGNAVKYVTEVDSSGATKKDDKGNYIFKKDDKGNLIAAKTYQVEVDEKGDPKADKDGNWVFVQKDGKPVEAKTYQVDVDDKGKAKTDAAGHTLFVLGPDKKPKEDPKGQNLASDQNDPAEGPQYFPDDKGVYVADPADAPGDHDPGQGSRPEPGGLRQARRPPEKGHRILRGQFLRRGRLLPRRGCKGTADRRGRAAPGHDAHRPDGLQSGGSDAGRLHSQTAPDAAVERGRRRCRQAAQLQLPLHPGVHRHPDPRRFRVGHLDGRGGQEPEEAHPLGGPALAGDPGRHSATCSSTSRPTTS